MTSPRSNWLSLPLALIVAVAACSGGTTDPPQDTTPRIQTAGGNGQTGNIGEALGNPATVRVTRNGAAVSGTTVTWTVTGGGGSVDPTTSVTDAAGEASTEWTLGPSPGSNTMQASAAGHTGSPVTFAATGEDPTPPATAAVSVGDNFFNPASARVASGGTVTWTWTGSVGHNVTFPSGPNSATQSAGTFARTFATVGSFDYQCTIHGGMTGTIVVE